MRKVENGAQFLESKTMVIDRDAAEFSSLPFLGEMQRIAFRLMLSSFMYVCVCVCVCLSVCLYVYVCVYAAFVDLRKTV